MPKPTDILLSVIIPHYGTPELLRRCVASIPKRNDIQCIVIEDTGQKGAGWARNRGLESAKGKWVTFVDADDLLPEDFGKILDTIRDREDEDILFFRNRAVQSDNISIASQRENYERCFKRYFNKKDDSFLRFRMSSLWGKFFRLSFIESHNIRFEELKWSNDTFFSLQAGCLAGRIAVFPDIAYILTEHPGSLTSDDCRSMEEWQARYDVLIRKRDYLLGKGIKCGANEYQWLLEKLVDRNFRAFLHELSKLKGTHCLIPSLFTVSCLRIRRLFRIILPFSCRRV